MSTSAKKQCIMLKLVVEYIDMKMEAMQYEIRPTTIKGPRGEFTVISSWGRYAMQR